MLDQNILSHILWKNRYTNKFIKTQQSPYYRAGKCRDQKTKKHLRKYNNLVLVTNGTTQNELCRSLVPKSGKTQMPMAPIRIYTTNTTVIVCDANTMHIFHHRL